MLSNLLGTAILFVSNSWVTFMISPAGVDDAGKFTGTLWQAVNNFTWMPINIHRLIANVVFGGTIAAAYAAFRFLGAKTDEERARYDWMGYIGNFVALSALMVLPFAGYWLGFEIYGYNQTMGITMMGGFMSWLWIVQAILIGVLFLGSNYYLWLGMERIPGAERFRPWIKYLLLVIALGFMVWATPRSLIASLGEVRAMGGSDHRFLRFFGVMTREEHRGEPHDPHDVLLVPAVPPGEPGAHRVVGADGDAAPVRDLRARRRRRGGPGTRRLLRGGDRPHPALLAAAGRARSSCAS